jgi:radical SAM-linked protein
LIYEKGGDFRYIGHLDWMRMVYRMIGRCNMNIVYTQGFNPHPKVAFSPALAIGVTGKHEYFDFHTAQEYTTDELEAAFKSQFQAGMQLNSIIQLAEEDRDVQPIGDIVKVNIPEELSEQIISKLAEFKAIETMPYVVHKKDAERVYDLKQVIVEIDFKDNELQIKKQLKSPGVFDMLAVMFEIPKDSLYGWDIIREGFVY